MRFAVALVACAASLVAGEAHAQRELAVATFVGSGLSLGTGNANENASVAARRSPTFLDVELGQWNPERPDPVLGAALRVEIDGRVGVALVPRAGIRRRRGAFDLRAAFGLPIFVAPFSLVGGEVAMGLGIPIGGGFSLVTDVLVGAYFWGSDLPSDSALVKLDLRVGLELRP